MCETGTDQQVAQFLDSYIMMMKKKNNPSRREEFNPGLLVRSQSSSAFDNERLINLSSKYTHTFPIRNYLSFYVI
jgi:hypothetical protein